MASDTMLIGFLLSMTEVLNCRLIFLMHCA